MMTELEICRGCGCTNDHACPGGCHWVKPGLCSTCADRQLRALVKQVFDWLQMLTPAQGEISAQLAGRPALVICDNEGSNPSLAVQDHVGAVVFEMDRRRTFLAHQYDAAEVMAMFENLMKQRAA